MSNNKLQLPLALSPAPRGLTHANISGNAVESLGDLSAYPYLESFVARGNKIKDVAPLSACKRLAYLDVSNNEIKDISTLDLPQLAYLNASGNSVRDVSKIGPLASLRTLDLSENKITSLKGIGGLSKLVELNVTKNDVSTIHHIGELEALSALRELDLRDNPLQRIKQYRLRALFVVPMLAYLDGQATTTREKVDAANLKQLERPVKQALLRNFLPQGDRTTPSSRYQHRFSQDMSAFTSELPVVPFRAYRSRRGGLGESIVGDRSAPQPLEEAQFWWQMAEKKMIPVWADLIRHVKVSRTRELDFSGLVIGDVGLWSIAQALSDDNDVVKLNVSGSYDPTRWSAARSQRYGLRRMLDAVAISSVVDLDLSGCRLGIESAFLVAKLIRESKTLERLDLSGNYFGRSVTGPAPVPFTSEEGDAKTAADGLEIAALVLKPCPGLEALCAALVAPESAPVRDLGLAQNGICGYGAAALARMLANPACSIEALDISENDLLGEGYLRPTTAGREPKTEGGVLIAEALKVNRSLVSLSLSGRYGANTNEDASSGPAAGSITTSVVEAIARALLTRNRTLLRLDLSFTRCGDEGAKALARALADTPMMQRHIPRLQKSFASAGGRGGALATRGLPTDVNLPSAAPPSLELERDRADNERRRAEEESKKKEDDAAAVDSKQDSGEAKQEPPQPTEEMLEGGVGSVLESLNLRGAGIGSQGIAALGQSLERNSKLRELNLADNAGADAESVEALVTALCANESLALEKLDLSGLQFESQGQGAAEQGWVLVSSPAKGADTKSANDTKAAPQAADAKKTDALCVLYARPESCAGAAVAALLEAASGIDGLTFRIEPRDPPKGDGWDPAYDALGACEAVPGLQVEGGDCVYGASAAIKAIIERFKLVGPFMPRLEPERKRTEAGLAFCDGVLLPLLRRTALVKIAANGQGVDRDAVGKALAELNEAPNALPFLTRRLLAGRDFIGGKRPCVADYSVCAALVLLESVTPAYTRRLSYAYPTAVRRYLARLDFREEANKGWRTFTDAARAQFVKVRDAEPIIVPPSIEDRVLNFVLSKPTLRELRVDRTARAAGQEAADAKAAGPSRPTEKEVIPYELKQAAKALAALRTLSFAGRAVLSVEGLFDAITEIKKAGAASNQPSESKSSKSGVLASLRVLELTEMTFSPQSWTAMCNVVAEAPRLERVALDGLDIDPVSFGARPDWSALLQAFFRALESQGGTVRELSLRGSPGFKRTGGVKALAQCLAAGAPSNLCSIDISGSLAGQTQAGADDIRSLMQALGSSPSLESLAITDNELTSADMLTLTMTRIENLEASRLRSLDCSGNVVTGGPEAYFSLVESLLEITSLKELSPPDMEDDEFGAYDIDDEDDDLFNVGKGCEVESVDLRRCNHLTVVSWRRVLQNMPDNDFLSRLYVPQQTDADVANRRNKVYKANLEQLWSNAPASVAPKSPGADAKFEMTGDSQLSITLGSTGRNNQDEDLDHNDHHDEAGSLIEDQHENEFMGRVMLNRAMLNSGVAS